MKILVDFSTANQDEYLFNYSIYECIIRPLVNKDVSIDVIMSKELVQKLVTPKNCRFIPLDYNLYKNFGYSIEEVFEFLYNGKDSNKYFLNITSIYKELLKNTTPDVIITFEYGNCILKNMFPKTLNLTWLGGVWKSIPPDFSAILDPINSCAYSSLIKFKNEIKSFKINENQQKDIKKLKSIFKNKIISTKIAQKELLQYKKQFKHLILLPLQLDGNIFNNECNFTSQLEYLDYVFSKVPREIGIIVTGHTVNIEEIKNIARDNKEKYPNLIIIDELFKYAPQSSLFVLPYIDAMINVCSSLVLKALLCDVPIISLSNNYNIWCQDADNLNDIITFLSTKHDNKDNIMYWYMTHYDIPVKKVCSKNFLYNYLKDKIKYSENIDFSFFKQEVDMKYVIDYYKKIKFNRTFKDKKLFDFKTICDKYIKKRNIKRG